MLINLDGSLSCSEMELEVPDEMLVPAQRVGWTQAEGLERLVEDYLGISIEGAKRFTVTDGMEDRGMTRIRVQSDWVRPTRRR